MTTIKTTMTKKSIKKYPYLGHFNKEGNDFVVLFVGHGLGTVVYVGLADKGQVLGKHEGSWIESEFESFHGTVTISAGE